VALHFNHRLRGRESAGDAAFCRTVCRHLGVPLRSGAWEDAPVCASEAEARAARHEFFRREMKRVRTGVLWLAHQQDDVAESMLMRLARGSGTAGLAAPRPLQPQADGRVYVRPFLAVRKAELAAALRRAGARWRIDSSNARADHFRNRVRQKVLPGWVAAAGRDAIAGAALSRERLEEDDVALEGWLAELRPMDRRGRLDLSRMQARPRALWRRALQRWLLAQPHGSDLSRAGFEQLLAAVERGRDTRCSLGPRGFAVIRRGKLLFIDAGPR
jgi:tRNA(Ile)-lysidine synthase